MSEATTPPNANHSVQAVLVALALVSAGLLVGGRADYPELHTVLDTGVCLLSGMLALLLWDLGSRSNQAVLKALAVSLAATWLLELVHVMVTVEWSGALAPIARSKNMLRPATWPPAAYVLPIGFLGALWTLRRPGSSVVGFGLILFFVGLGLLGAFYVLPRYTSPTWLGITRPALLAVPVLWALVTWLGWRNRAADRVFRVLALMAVVLALGHVAMLYSRAPHDTAAMVAHMGKLTGYLILLLSLMQMAAHDVRERIHVQRALAESNARLEYRVIERTRELADSHARMQAIFDTALDGLVTMDHEGRIAAFNQAAERIFGYDQGEVLGRPLHEVIIPPAQRERHTHGLARYLATGESTILGKRIELTGLRGDGQSVALELSVNRMPGDGSPLFAGFVRDITARKQAESRLATQLERFSLLDRITRAIGERQDLRSIFQVVVRSLEDHLPIDFGCICTYEAPQTSMIVTCVGVRSHALALQLAMPEQAHIDIDQNGLSRCVRGELVYEPDIAQVRFPFPGRLAGGGLRSLVICPLLVESNVFGVLVAARGEVNGFSSADCEFLRQLSEHVALAAHQARIYTALQQAYDDLHETQRTVMQQERLRVLGQMASGIAHDINNALSPVALYTESLLERESGLSENGRGQLATIQRAIDDVAETVARMKEFYRPREPQMQLARIDLNQLVQQAIDLTHARWSDQPQQRGMVIDLQVELAVDLSPVAGAESEIRDALTNLIFNAVDAMPEGGRLVLRTEALARRDGHGDTAPVACVEVVDTGVGMDEETRRRCLEPFFTTKGERGSGLGLAMVYGMIQRHSGNFELESQPGEGTTVRLVFPAAATTLSVTTLLQETTQRPIRRLRILLIDDDPLVIESLSEVLQVDGHTVTTADGGRAGIDAFVSAEQRGEPFALVITDLGMPYVDGRQVAARIRAASAVTPIILLTGWGQRLVAANEVPPEVSRVLSKPPKLREVRAALAELTGGTGG